MTDRSLSRGGVSGVLVALVAFLALAAVDFVGLVVLHRDGSSPSTDDSEEAFVEDGGGDKKKSAIVRDIFIAVLDRMPHPSEKAAFVRAMTRGGMTERQIAEHLRRSSASSLSSFASYSPPHAAYLADDDGADTSPILEKPPHVPFLERDEASRARLRKIPDERLLRAVVYVYARLLDRLPTVDEATEHVRAAASASSSNKNDDDVRDRIKKAVRLTETAVRRTPEFIRLNRLGRAYNRPYREIDDEETSSSAAVHTARRDAAIMAAWKAANEDSGGGARVSRPPPFEWHVLRTLYEDLDGDEVAFEKALRGIRRRKNELQATGTPSSFPDAAVSLAAPYESSRSESRSQNEEERNWGEFNWMRDVEARLV